MPRWVTDERAPQGRRDYGLFVSATGLSLQLTGAVVHLFVGRRTLDVSAVRIDLAAAVEHPPEPNAGPVVAYRRRELLTAILAAADAAVASGRPAGSALIAFARSREHATASAATSAMTRIMSL